MVALGRTGHGHIPVVALAAGIVETRAAEEGGHVVAGPPRVRSGGAVPGQRCMHDARVEGQHAVGIEAESFLSVNQQVAHEDVGARDEAMHHRLALIGVQVHGNRSLAAVVDVELTVQRFQRTVDLGRTGEIAHGIPGGRLDLDHVGAKIRQ